MARTYPLLICQIATTCDSAWLVGSAADPSVEQPKDYDLVVSAAHWHIAAQMIPKDAKVNSFGGWKCVSEGCLVDIWPEEIGRFMTSRLSGDFAFHIRSGVLLKKQERRFV